MFCRFVQAAQLDKPGLQAYLKYLQHGLFSSFAPPAELERAHRLFLRLAALPADGEDLQPAAGGGSSVAPQAHEPALNDVTGASPGAGQPSEQQAPRRPPSAYLHYGAALRGRPLFHPDYALVLAGCAALVWLTPDALHEVRLGLS